MTQRFVVTRLRFLGDVVMTTPILDALRAAYPDARLDYVCSDVFAPVLEHHPSLDRVFSLPSGSGWRGTSELVRKLRHEPIDWWIDLFGNPRSVMLAALARPRRSVGGRRGLRSHLFTHRREDVGGLHSVVGRYLDKLVPILGEAPPETRPTLTLAPGEAERRLERCGLSAAAEPWVFHAGSTWPDKAWPRERWMELAQRCVGRAPIWFLHPPGETELMGWFAERLGSSVRFLPTLALRDCLAVLSRARLFVGNDGGIMHMSVALGRPTLGLFGPTEPSVWFPYPAFGPYRVLHQFNPAGPCDDCGVDHTSRLAHLSVEDVMATIDELKPEIDRAHS